MEPVDFFKITEKFPAEFAAAKSFAEFAASLDASKPGPGRVLQHIAERYGDEAYMSTYFHTVKAHGFVSRALSLPNVKTVAELFESVSLLPYSIGGDSCEIAGMVFVSGLRAKGFDYFGHLGATYDWSPKWLERNPPEYIRRVSKPNQFLTGAKPSAALVEAWGSYGNDREWSLATVEAIRWEDGRTLICGRSRNGFGTQWLALLNPGETAVSMLSDHERGEIEAEKQAQIAAWGNVSGEF